MGALILAAGFKEANIQESQGKLDEQIALRNQKALERQAKAEVEASKIEESRISRKGKAAVAAAVAQAGKTGGQLKNASESALTDIVAQFSIDRNLTLRRGLIKSRELTQRGKIIGAEGRFAKKLGKQRASATRLRTTGEVALLAAKGGAGAA